MGGLVIDIYIEFAFRAIVRFFKGYGSKSWLVVTGEVTSTNLLSGYGCTVAEVTYKFRLEGELYTGMNAKPFVIDNSAKEYLERHPAGSEILIRVKPGLPQTSVVREHDSYLRAHGYRLES